MTQATTGYINLGDGKLYYEVQGEGETLVLVHAGIVDSRMWDDQWDDFTQRYRVIRYDARGFGKSDVVKSPVSRREDLLGVLDHLNVERVHLLGCSLGGETVIDFTLDHPERVLSLIPVSAAPSGFQMQGEPPAEIGQMMEAAQKGDLQRVTELQMRMSVDGPSRQPEQVNPRVRERAAEMNRIAVANQTFAADMNPKNPLQPPAAGRLQEINVPTLIMAGALDNAEIVRIAGVMASSIKGAQKVVTPGGAHLPNMENPDAFNRAVLDFLGERK